MQGNGKSALGRKQALVNSSKLITPDRRNDQNQSAHARSPQVDNRHDNVLFKLAIDGKLGTAMSRG